MQQLKNLVLKLLEQQLFAELSNPSQAGSLNLSDRMREGSPEGRNIRDMITQQPPDGPLWLDPKEVRILEVIEKGPMKQAAIVSALEMEINATTVKELLCSLIRRRIIFNGPDGYQIMNYK